MPKKPPGAAVSLRQKKSKTMDPVGRRVINYRSLTVMQYRKNISRSSWALTLVEMIIAMVIMAIVFVAVIPQIRLVRNSWDTKAETFETLQNGRVLIDHLNQNLSTAVRVTSVSGPSETNGYIEFMDNASNSLRYDMSGTSNYVEFGSVGELYDLAGPVSQLLFTCDDGNDFDTAITDAKGYVNGVHDFTENKSGTIVTDTGSFTFGYSDDQYFEGFVDEVRLYNRALNPEEVTELAGGIFQQDEDSDGIVSMEAEHYTINNPQGGHQWTLVTSPGGYSDEGAMEATPDSGTNQDTNYTANSPRLDFLVNFVKTGTHYVWVRGYGKDGSADSCHAGPDGQEISTCDRMNYFGPLYAWHEETLDGPDATFNVSTVGIHTVNIWMREDGCVIDKIVLTTNLTYTPFGSGPAESEQSEPGGGGALIP